MRQQLPPIVEFQIVMPELAEVEHYRRRWNCGLGKRIFRIHIHAEKRIFRGISIHQLREFLTGSIPRSSLARGKQILFHFSNDVWLGIHLGMTGTLRVAQPDFQPSKHDHLVLFQKEQALVFNDPRLFGRVLFHHGAQAPLWWAQLPPALDSKSFTIERAGQFLQKHRRLPIKSALLLQSGFPGIGNWMADEILWRTGLSPHTPSGSIQAKQLNALWESIQWVSHTALKVISPKLADPPAGWLFHERWSRDGKCPLHHTPLKRETVGGRTTAWCPECQK